MSHTGSDKSERVRVDPVSDGLDAELRGLNVVNNNLDLDVVPTLSHRLLKQHEQGRRLLAPDEQTKMSS